MQLNLTSQSLKLIMQLAKQKRKEILKFRGLYYGQKGIRYRMDDKLRLLEALIADILQAVKVHKDSETNIKSHK